MPLMRITIAIYAEDEKGFRNWERFAFSWALARLMYPHLTEDSEIFFEVGSDVIREIRRTTSHHLG